MFFFPWFALLFLICQVINLMSHLTNDVAQEKAKLMSFFPPYVSKNNIKVPFTKMSIP